MVASSIGNAVTASLNAVKPELVMLLPRPRASALAITLAPLSSSRAAVKAWSAPTRQLQR